MQSYIFWTVMLVIGGALIAVASVFMRSYLGGVSPASRLFKSRPERRIEVVDYTALDARRKLVLIRRDDVEHLLLTGGPVDVVVETGITAQPAKAANAPAETLPIRRAPTFGVATEPVFSSPRDTEKGS